MHSPEVLAFTIRRPWPTIRKRDNPTGPRRHFFIYRLHERWHASAFAYLGGYELYLPSMIDVWHMEPGGADSLTVCKNRIVDDDGNFERWSTAWKWHVHHWKVAFPILRDIRRALFTRCEWCGSRQRKRDRLNNSCRNWSAWTPLSTTRFGERSLMHWDCMSVATASRKCFCADPMLDHGDYGRCLGCGHFRAWREDPTPADFLLASLSRGSRIPESMKAEVERLRQQARQAQTQQTTHSTTQTEEN